MKIKNIIASGLFCSLSAQVSANTFNAPLVEQSLLLDAATATNIVVVGERSHVILSDDNGTTFTQASLPLTTTLTAVAAHGQKLWVAGHDATIMYSQDAGLTWQVQMHQPELERPFLDIHFFDASVGIALGAYGLFYRTEDGGQTWNEEQHQSLLNPMDIEYLEEIKQEDEAFYLDELSSILPHLNRIEAFGDRLYIAGETGLVAISDNQGRDWQRFDLDYAGSFFDIAPLSENVTIAAGLRGTVYLRTDLNGWQRVETCTTATLNSIFIDSEKVLIVGNNGAIVDIDLASLLKNPRGNCGENGVSFSQTPTKSAISTVIKTANGLTGVTSDGLQPLGRG